MMKFKKLSLLIVIAFLIQTIPLQPFIALADVQAVPTQLSIAGTIGNPNIGYASVKGHYVNLNWIAPQWGGDTQYYELYYAEDGKAYEKYGEAISSMQTSIEMQKLKGGMVYHAYLKAIHEHFDTDGKLTGKDESQNSNEIVFMTNIEIAVAAADDNSLDIQWTDINYKGRRPEYNLYISESKAFGQTPPVYIGQSNIGATNTVKPISGKLQYKATELKAGTVYYIKIQPLLNDDQVQYLTESKIVNGYTYILARIARMSSDWWRLEWNPVTNTNLQENQEVIYKIKRCVVGDLEKEISATKDTQMFVKVTDVSTYYKIQADIVSELGEQVSIISPEVYATETEVSTTPGVPEIMDELSDKKMVVDPTSLNVLWKVPSAITGDFDQSIKYDIWMLDSPNDINNNAIVPMVSNLPKGPENYLYKMVGNTKSDKVIGYQYTITGLTPNKTYYLKIVATKKYVVNENGKLVSKDFSSEPALKAIITPPNGSIEQPVSPAKPPFKVKTTVLDGKTEQLTTSKSVTLEWKNKWYELWDETNNKWKYATENEALQASVQGEVYRFINYGSDIKFSVGYEVYTDNFDFSRLSETVSLMPMQFNDVPNNINSDTVEMEVTGLSPNTTYVMWIRAYRTNSIRSELSDPIMATTKTGYEIPKEKPAIPTFNYKNEGDTYTEIGWNVINGYAYTIRYSTEDNISDESNQTEVTKDKLQLNNKYKVEGLKSNTTYFFWIMATVKDGAGISLNSEWSDAYVIKTKPDLPPNTPLGFGLKNIDKPVDQHNIFYEWVKVNGLSYTIEVAKKIDFSDAVSYTTTNVSEYKLENLDSNTRYYARLYAYDDSKKLKSTYTATVSVRTLKSNEEYNSDVDLETDMAEAVKPTLDENKNGVLDITTGTNVDLLIKQIYDEENQDYLIDFAGLITDDKGITKSNTSLSARILVALNQMKKTFTVSNGKASLTIKPEILDNEQIKYIYKKNPGFIINITFEKPTTSATKPSGATLVSDQWKITLTAEDGGLAVPITGLKNAIKVKIPYTTSTWYDKNTMSGYTYNEQEKIWSKADTTNTFSQQTSTGLVNADISGSCGYAILKWSSSRFADIGGSSYEADINAVINKYNMKSLSDSNFEPNRNITKAEAVKMLLDVMNTRYDDNYMDMALKAKITSSINMKDTNSATTREQAASMLGRVYELITGQKAVSTYSLSAYSDANTVDPNFLPRVRFAVEKGILKNDWSSAIRPKYSLTRGEMMSMLKSTLIQAGEM